MTPQLIGLDWGTSSFRAWLMAGDGSVVAEKAAPSGILTVAHGRFEDVFHAEIGGWLADHPGLPVIASGMITSRNGWHETPYLPLPASARQLADNLHPFTTQSGHTIQFVTGLARLDAGTTPDVMRGEETELVGHIAASDLPGGLFVMPGTHSKWVTAANGEIRAFDTCMTGEAFALLRGQSILGRLAEDGPFREEAFRAGVRAALENRKALLSLVFSARTLVLFKQLATDAVPDYLSGLLIGDEVKAGLANHSAVDRPTIIGRGDLAERYRLAFEVFGRKALMAEPGMARRGLFEIGRLAKLS